MNLLVVDFHVRHPKQILPIVAIVVVGTVICSGGILLTANVAEAIPHGQGDDARFRRSSRHGVRLPAGRDAVRKYRTVISLHAGPDDVGYGSIVQSRRLGLRTEHSIEGVR
jgi:hypothetical protein